MASIWDQLIVDSIELLKYGHVNSIEYLCDVIGVKKLFYIIHHNPTSEFDHYDLAIETMVNRGILCLLVGVMRLIHSSIFDQNLKSDISYPQLVSCPHQLYTRLCQNHNHSNHRECLEFLKKTWKI